uniref:Uncharacterized protein n=1 Tax=Arundo donax TaxID=35708 RepID=A0A0A9FTY7_ARUDO
MIYWTKVKNISNLAIQVKTVSY